MAKALAATHIVALDHADILRKVVVLACSAALIFAGQPGPF